jgi:histidinol-phosphate/aromatic aminotransferase/cobyric acid decarboxylase-like protein
MHAFGDAETNVAEGYPSWELTHGQRRIVDQLPHLMLEAYRSPYSVVEANAQRALLWGLGQRTAPIGTGQILSYYSAGVAIDVVGRCLAGLTDAIGVIHPTLDCLPALMRARGPRTVAVSEERLRRPDPLRGLPAIGGLYIANPNNPTGHVLDPDQLRRLAESCARRGVALAIDSCFRVFDPRAQYDTYEVLDATGVDYVVIEDTGKLWPTGGVRLAFLAFPAHSKLGIPDASADLLFVAPPFACLLVEQFALDMAAGGMAVIHERIAANRAELAAALEGCEVATLAEPDSKVSMALVHLDRSWTSTRLWGRLIRRGVNAVPGRPIWWARPTEGERYLRVALARKPEVVARAAREIRAELDGH